MSIAIAIAIGFVFLILFILGGAWAQAPETKSNSPYLPHGILLFNNELSR